MIHPLAIQFLAESVGFMKPELRHLSLYPDEAQIGLMNPQDPELQILTKNFARLNDILIGCQDYALICEK